MKKLFVVPIMVTLAVLVTTLFGIYPVHADVLDGDYGIDAYAYASNDYEYLSSNYTSGIGSAFDSDESIYDLLDEIAQSVATVVFVIGFVISLFWCFFGFKVFKVYLAICGFLVGILLGLLVSMLLSEKIGAITLILIPVFAILGAILSYKLYKLGLFLTGFLALVVVGGFVTYAISKNTTASIVVGIILGIVAGIFLVKFNKPAIIISTGVQYGLLAGAFLSCIIAHTILIGVLGVIISVLGIMFQIKTNNGLFEKLVEPATTTTTP